MQKGPKYELYILNFHTTITDYIPEVLAAVKIVEEDDALRHKAYECARSLVKGDTDTTVDIFYNQILAGQPVQPLYRTFGPDGDGGLKGRRFYECIPEEKRKVLRQLHKSGKKVALLSTSGDKFVEWTLGDDAKYFDVILANQIEVNDGYFGKLRMKYKKKNKAPVIRKICDDLGVPPERTLCVGKDEWDACPGTDLKIVINGNLDEERYHRGLHPAEEEYNRQQYEKRKDDIEYARKILNTKHRAEQHSSSILWKFEDLLNM